MFDIASEPTTADIVSLLRLARMNSSTRTSTIISVREIRDTLGPGGDFPVAEFARIVETADAACRAALGGRHVQILSDARRALRLWRDLPLQRLALRLREGLPTLADAAEAAELHFGADRAKRAVSALGYLAASKGTGLDGIVATETVVVPLLLALSPEMLGVGTRKSLENKMGLIRAAVRLVDPNSVSGHGADLKALGPVWRSTLADFAERTPDHAEAVHAIFRRLAVWSDRHGKLPSDLSDGDLLDFVSRERLTHSKSHEDKLRQAAKIWNAAIDDRILDAPEFDRSRNVPRLPDVAWSEVPPVFRDPVDALLATAVSPLGEGAWSDLILQEEDDLGVPGIDVGGDHSLPGTGGRPGTQRNWRDAVKRIWHAVQSDPSITVKPEALEELWDPACVQAFVRAAWAERRQRLEAEGKDWDSHRKGRYEVTVIQTFVAVGRALHVAEERLDGIVAFSRKVDPAVLGQKKMPDGNVKMIYEDRRIGPKHEEMLRAFNEDSVLRRWFEAPDRLWSRAMDWRRRSNQPTLGDVALARSALIARLSQRVAPLRRTNIARLRCGGPAAHIHLPLGAGEGRLVLPAVEMKNLRRIEVRIDPETVKMLRVFIEVFRPVSMATSGSAGENEHLFPGSETERPELGAPGAYAPGFGYHRPDKMRATFAGHMWRHCALKMDMQVMRHIAGKVILDVDPSAMALVQEILGHKKIETTRNYYAEVSKIVAQRRYLELLDQATRRALRDLDFSITIEKMLEGRK